VARTLTRLAAAGVGLVAGRVVLAATLRSPVAADLERINHRGRTVSLAAGPALAVAASVTAAAGALAERRPALAGAALVAGLGAGAAGLYDDIAGAKPEQRGDKGFRGHLRALRQGRISSGLVKIGAIGGSGVIAAALLPPRKRPPPGNPPPGNPTPRKSGGAVDVVVGAGVIAGTANLVNLLDLRPGRALKAGAALAAPLLASSAGAALAGPLGTAAGLLPEDLDERVMLGDAGANALGALIGVALAAGTGRAGRAALFAGLAGLTAASERVSFTRVIERTPVLKKVDDWGRRAPEPR